MAKSRSKLAEAFVEIRTDDAPFRAGLSRVRKEVSATSGLMKTFAAGGSTILKGFVGGLGIGAAFAVWEKLGDGIRYAIAQATEGEKSKAKLRSTLASLGLEVESNFGKFEDFGELLKSQANVDDDVTRSLVTLALNLGVNKDQVEQLVAAAVGLAEVTGDDVTSSLDSLTKAVNGNFKALDKGLPTVRNAVTAEQKLAEISRLAQQGLRQKRDATQTLSGATEGLSRAYDDLAESVGESLTPSLITATNYAATLFRIFTTGTLESRVAFLELQKTLLKWQNPIGLDPKVQQQIQALDAEINRLTNDAIKGNDKATGTQLQLQKAVKETNKAYSDAADIVRKAQEAALEQAAVGIAATQAQTKAKDDAATKDKQRAAQAANAPTAAADGHSSTTKPPTAPAAKRPFNSRFGPIGGDKQPPAPHDDTEEDRVRGGRNRGMNRFGRGAAGAIAAQKNREEEERRRTPPDPSKMTGEQLRDRYQRVKDELAQMPGNHPAGPTQNAPGALGRQQTARRERLEQELLNLSNYIRGEGSPTAAKEQEYQKRKRRELEDMPDDPRNSARRGDMLNSLDRRAKAMQPKIDAERERSGVRKGDGPAGATTRPSKITFNSEQKLIDVLTRLDTKIAALNGGLA